MIIKVLVAEDEPYILRSIKQLIEESHTEFKIIGTAVNGLEALDKIKSLNPDVVFTDIKMPKLDGLTLVEKLKEEGLDFIPVIISGYQDFEYAKKAFKSGVFDYILKPISPETFENLLKEIYKRLQTKLRNEQLSVLNSFMDNNEYLSVKRNHLVFKHSNYYIMFFCSGSYCKLPSIWNTSLKDFWIKNNLYDISSGFFEEPDDIWVLNGEYQNERLLILGVSNDCSGITWNKMSCIYENLKAHSVPITTVAGCIGSNIENFHSFLKKSRMMLTKQIIFAKSSYISAEETQETYINETEPIVDNSLERLCRVSKQNRQLNSLKQELYKLLEHCHLSNYRQVKLERLLKSILSIYFDIFEESNEERSIQTDIEINELIYNSNNYEDIYTGMCILLDYLFNKSIIVYDEVNLEKHVERISKYIKANYAKPINLQSLSETFGLVAPHISRLFKKSMGISPTDYIIKLRIEKAKELLISNPHLVLKDIAEIIGFSDPFYFSKVFKNYTSLSPTEFKDFQNKQK